MEENQRSEAVPTGGDWQVVDEVAGAFQADILSGLLEAQGIHVIVSMEGSARVYAFTVGDMARAQLLVAAQDVERAREVLEEYYAGTLANTEMEGIEDLPSEDDLGEEA